MPSVAPISEAMKRIKPSPTIAMTDLARALKAQGRDIISLSVGEPDFDTPDNIKQAAIEAIKQVKARYFRFMDMREWEAMGQVFTKDAVFDCSVGFQHVPLGGEPIGVVGPVTQGREAIIAWIADAFVRQTSVHHGHGHEIQIDSDSEAQGIVAMQDYIYAPDRTTLLLKAAGHYHETYRFEDGQWRIATSRLTRLVNHVAPAFYTAGVDAPQGAVG